jgi:hypothetical protein
MFHITFSLSKFFNHFSHLLSLLIPYQPFFLFQFVPQKENFLLSHTKKKSFLCPLSHLSPICVCEKNPNDFSRPNCLDTREQLKKASLDVLFGYSMLRKSLFQLSCVVCWKLCNWKVRESFLCSREDMRITARAWKKHDNILNEFFM